jgi:hypothetical protein
MSLRRGLAVWLLLALLMSVNGVFRELVLRPAVGPTTADALSAALGIAIILTTKGSSSARSPASRRAASRT